MQIKWKQTKIYFSEIHLTLKRVSNANNDRNNIIYLMFGNAYRLK